MTEHQEHFGKKFYKDKKTGYWISTTAPRMRAHQWVWFSHHGKPPKKCHIHHKDENKSNNQIENLELVFGKQHVSHHMIKMMRDPQQKEKAKARCDKIRPMTIAWHKSEEGRAWHKYHAIKTKFGNGEHFDYTCQECSSAYKSKLKADGRTRFCSNACKSKWRRKMKLDDVDKTCPVCKKEYRSSKYSRSKTCGRSCGKKSLPLIS